MSGGSFTITDEKMPQKYYVIVHDEKVLVVKAKYSEDVRKLVEPKSTGNHSENYDGKIRFLRIFKESELDEATLAARAHARELCISLGKSLV